MLGLRLLGVVIGIGCVVFATYGSGTKSGLEKLKPKFTVREEPSRIVLTWSGPVAEPMRDDVMAALDRFKADPRRIVVTLNSPGGSVAHGRLVAAAIRSVSQERPVDTLVEQGGVCASMCVPIYLAGAQRLAHPAAHFMFHLASVNPAGPVTALGDDAAVSKHRKVLEALATDDLYEHDMGSQGVNAAWLAYMRRRIDGRDVWVTGQQLVDEGSGIVKSLVGTVAR